jgi:hypothetical protein
VDDSFFDHVRNAAEGFVGGIPGTRHATSHSRGVKVWFGDSTREHYEAQLIRDRDVVKLEIGFHAEHPNSTENEAVLAHLVTLEPKWREHVGDEAETGPFIGRKGWTRISECWEPPATTSIDEAIEVAARLADYVNALEPLRRERPQPN